MNLTHELAKINSNFADIGRSLSREEIDQLLANNQITLPERIKEHSMGPRVSFPDRLNATTFGLRLMSKRIGK